MATSKFEKGTLLSLKLKEGLYTLAYVLKTSVMQYFDIQSKDGNWNVSEAKELKPLFKGCGVRSVKKIVDKKVKGDNYIFDKGDDEILWIRPKVNSDNNGFVFKGGDLVSEKEGGDYVDAPIVKRNLTLPEDRELIEQYELVNMWGADSLSDRLIRYFEKGINRDDLKFEVFPGLWNDREELRPLTSRLPEPLR